MSTLKLPEHAKQRRSELKRGFRIEASRKSVDGRGRPQVSLKTRKVGVCGVDDDGNDILWKDLTPQQRKKLRKERAGRKQTIINSLSERLMRLQGEHDSAEQMTRLCVERGDWQGVTYYRDLAARLRSRRDEVQQRLDAFEHDLQSAVTGH